MISVRRGEPPEGFAERIAIWKAKFEEAKKADDKLSISKFWTRIRGEITDDAIALFKAFRGKCAFCESYMTHVSNANIEHYRPKSKSEFQYLAFEWHNWLLACNRCNDKKWRHFPACGKVPCLINPVDDAPDEHLYFVRSLILAKTQRGERTIKLIGLDRSPLEDERVRWLSYINVLLLLYLVEDAKLSARNMLIWCMQDDAPYSAMTRAYLREATPFLASASHPRVNLQEPISQIEHLVETYRDEIKTLL